MSLPRLQQLVQNDEEALKDGVEHVGLDEASHTVLLFQNLGIAQFLQN
jgi:hypothetical protein